MDIDKLLGQEVTLEGIAKDAKGGAVLIIPDDIPIYIKGLDFWPDEYFDKQVSVTGIFNEEKLIPDPYVDEDGAISCGAEGLQLTISDAVYKII